eukprot:COSAG01_NODE_63078_length_281_cov_1.126374_1_plen_62_part_01
MPFFAVSTFVAMAKTDDAVAASSLALLLPDIIAVGTNATGAERFAASVLASQLSDAGCLLTI